MPLIGKGVECAIHCLSYFLDKPEDVSIGVSELAEFQGISESYLAKIFAKLNHAGLVKSSKGLRGGYDLARNPEDISYWDIILALDPNFKLFECSEIRTSCILIPKNMKEQMKKSGLCEIHHSMKDIESTLIKEFKKQNLSAINNKVRRKITVEQYQAGINWFTEKSNLRRS